MKKRILAMLLAAALMLGMLPTVAFAEESSAPVYLAAFAPDISVDGNLTEAGWITDGQLSDGTRFGVLWDSGCVYFAIAKTGALSVKLGQQTLSVAEDGTVSGIQGASAVMGTGVVEIKIPYVVTDYSHTVALTVTRGEASWAGTLGFGSLVRENHSLNYTITGTAPVDSANLGSDAVDGGFRMYNSYAEGAANAGSARVYEGTANSAVPWLADRSATLTMEYDFRVDAMPEYDSWSVARTYCCFGFSMAVTDSAGAGYVAGITNTADGLLYCVLKANGVSAFLLDKTLGESFHIRQDWTPEGNLEVYVDGIRIHTFDQSELTADEAFNNGWKNKNIIIFNLWGDGRDLTSDGAADIDFTFSNLKMGKVSVSHALEGLDFDAIKGSNTDAAFVSTKLSLPDTWSNGQLAAQKINWSSSVPEVIAADGTVTRPIEATEVTLTASLDSDPSVTKAITVTVARKELQSVFKETAMTLDGVRGEGWPANMEIGVTTDTAPYGGIASMWCQEKLYFFINYIRTPKTVTLTIADKEWVIDLSQSQVSDGALTGVVTSNTVELCLDMKAAGLKLLDYCVSYDFQVTLSGDNGTTLLSQKPIALSFVIGGNSITTIDSSMVDANLVKTFTYSGNTIGYKLTGTTSRDYIFTKTLAIMDGAKDMQFDLSITVNAMPVSDGKIYGPNKSEGCYFILTDEKYNNTRNCKSLFAGLFNSEANGLTLRILVDGVSKNYSYDGWEDIVLNKHVGDTFTLGLRWNADETAVVYVDGKQVGKPIVGATLVTSGLTPNAIQLNYVCTTAGADAETDLSFTDLKLTQHQAYYTSIKEEITAEDLFAGVDLKAVAEDLTLPTTFTSKYLGELPLTWVSDSESVIAADGTVTRPEGTKGQYVTLTLYVGGQKVFSVYPYVLPETVIVPTSPAVLGAAFSAAEVVVDGAATDEGWSMNTKLQTASGEQLGRLGVQWDTENLYLAVETGGLTPTVKLGETVVDLAGAVTVSNVMEIAVPLSSLGVSVRDYGTEIPAEVTLGEASWKGTIVLTSNDWFSTGSTAPYPAAPLYGAAIISGVGFDDPTANQGAAQLADGWQLYDIYDPEGNNPANVRSYVVYQNLREFDDASVDTFVEFDFYAASMPVYTEGEATRWESRWACYGFSWLFNRFQDSNKMADSVALGIYNSGSGLVLVALGSDTYTVPLNRQVGDLFRIGTRWNTDGSVTVFLDGEAIAEFENMTVSRRAMGTAALNMSLVRSGRKAESFNDNFEISITNLAFGKAYGDKLMDSLNFDSIKGENTDPYSVQSDLNLPTKLANSQLDPDVTLTWSCSDPTVFDAEGKFTQPENGKLVTLTVSASNGDTKTFELYVVGKNLTDDVLYVENDTATASGAGQKAEFYHFTLDATNNSVIRDLKEIKTVNVIALRDSDTVSRLNESVLTIWVSDDNVSYSRIDSFKLLRSGEYVYLYDFEATGRYIKVHCTHYDGTEADFTAPLQGMIDAYYEAVFGAKGGTFTEDTITVTNSESVTVYDKTWEMVGEYQRVLLDGSLLYHYTEAGKTYVRIPTVAAGETVTLTVLSGNTDAMNTENREYTLEVVYGTREVVCDPDARWLCALPDGRILSIAVQDEDMDGLANNYIGFNWSYDGGLTWTKFQRTGFDYKHCKSIAGILYDPDVGEHGRIIAQGYHNVTFDKNDGSKSDCKTRFIYSDDLGETWYASEQEITILGNQTNYYLTYTPPYKLSTADGEGEGIDYVLPLGTQPIDDTTGSFVGRVAYSCDAGLSWTMGESEIRFEGEGMLPYESGVSEATILEREDGTLIYYGRCQFESSNYFAMATSEDGGKTWSSATMSTVYSVNTQPLFYEFGDTDLLTWAGNNALGGNSYKRYPMNVAYTNDGGMTFENIQNLWSRYSLQNLNAALGSAGSVTNQSVTSTGDTLLVAWNARVMKIDGFTDYFFRTKGAYDSFENATTKYEGWSNVGSVMVSGDYSMEGEHSMKILDGASAIRSIPYVQDGKIAFNLYLDDVNGKLRLELESAYSDVFGEAAPIAMEISGGKLCGLALNQGWNEIVFDLALTAGTATITVNGETAELDPDLNIGDYICYVEIGNGNTVAYVDEFMVQDLDAQEVPEAPEAPEVPQPELPKISGNLSLNETIDINFIIPAEVDMTDAVLVVKNAATGEDVEYTILPGIGGTTVVRYRARANHMTDEITVQVFDAEGNPLTQKASMSVRKYAGIRFAVAEETEKMMLIRMLDYGALAQINSGVTTDLANSIVTDELRNFANAYDWADAVQLEVPAGSGGVFKAGLALNETIDVTVYTAATNVAEGDKFVVKCNGEELAEDQYIVRLLDDGRYVIRYSVKSNEMSDEIYIAIVGEDNTVKAETTLGVRIYAQKFLAAVPTGNQAAMLLAMLDYGALAQIYAGNTENLANCFVTDTLRQVLINYPWPVN